MVKFGVSLFHEKYFFHNFFHAQNLTNLQEKNSRLQNATRTHEISENERTKKLSNKCVIANLDNANLDVTGSRETINHVMQAQVKRIKQQAFTLTPQVIMRLR